MANLANCKLLASIDISQFFWQIPASKFYEFSATLVTEIGFYASRRVLQGDQSAPASAQYISQSLLTGVKNSSSLVDDISWGSKTSLEHIQSFVRLLQNLNYCSEIREPVKLRADKLALFQSSLKFCGRVVSDGKIYIESHKMRAFLSMKPRTNSDMCSYLAFTQYFASHINDIVFLIKALRDPLRGRSSAAVYSWTPELEEKFQGLKGVLGDLPSFFIPDLDPHNPCRFFLFTDASRIGIGGLLTQEKFVKKSEGKTSEECFQGMPVPPRFAQQAPEGFVSVLHPISYFARGFNGAEQRYSICKSELLGVVESMDRFIKVMGGRPAVILTDNSFTHATVKAVAKSSKAMLNDVLMGRLAEQLSHTKVEMAYIRSTLNPSDHLS